MNKTQKVLSHLMQYKTITPAEAFTLYGSMRLADIIFRLRGKGHRIETIIREGKSKQTGDDVCWGEYNLVKLAGR